MPKWNKRLPLSGLDPEVVDICVAMNKLDGVRTTESCCGHGTEPYRIFFQVSKLKCLTIVYYFISERPDWNIQFTASNMLDLDRIEPSSFVLIGPIGDEAYRDSKDIADEIIDLIANLPKIKAENEKAMFEDLAKAAQEKLDSIKAVEYADIPEKLIPKD